MEATYTITVKIKRTYKRKVDRRSKLDDIERRVRRALPEGWEVDSATISSKTVTAKSKKRAVARKKKAAKKRKAESKARAEKREYEKRLREQAKEAEAERKRRLKETFVSPHFGGDAAFMYKIIENERLHGLKVYQGDADACWRGVDIDPTLSRGMGSIRHHHLTSITIDEEGRKINGGKVDRVYVTGHRAIAFLLKNGVAVSGVPFNILALLHEIAHIRRWQATGAANHDRKWQQTLLRLVKKYCPEACTEEAIALETLRSMG